MPTPAIRHLRQSDPRLGEWIERLGVLQLPTPQVREPYVALPSPKQLLKFSEKWRPHRSVAALYLWRLADTAKKPKKKRKKSLFK